MKMHQLITENPGVVKHRETSCLCEKKICAGHKLSEFMFSINKINAQNTTSDSLKDDTVDNSEIETEQNTTEKTSEKSKATSQESILEIRRKEGRYRRYLKTYQQCKNFDELKEECVNVQEQLNNVSGTSKSSQEYSVDAISTEILPRDLKEKGDVAVKVRADGDCLPGSGSVFIYGNDKHPSEIRTRIIIEQVLNEDFYLDEQKMLQGYKHDRQSKNLMKSYAMYSDEYMHDRRLSNDVVQEIYRREIMKITKEKTYMGIWQIHSLASILKVPICSIYPELGNQVVRGHLYRIVYPRDPESAIMANILWTTTRIDMNNNNWVPNHFVPVLPLDVSRNTPVENITVRLAYKDSLTIPRTFQTTNSIYVDTDDTVDNYVSSYVLIEYHAYPGYVENVDSESQMLYVECMHRVGSKDANCFSWPRKILDKNWYDFEDILGMISQPKAIEGTTHYQVDDKTWNKTMEKLQKRTQCEGDHRNRDINSLIGCFEYV